MSAIFTSRKFWIAVLALAAIILAAAVPNFQLDQERGAGFAVIVVSYILGLAVDPGPGGWKGVIQSRKFWAAALGFVVVFLDGFGVQLPFGITEDQLVEIAVVIGVYISGVALEGKIPAYHPTR